MERLKASLRSSDLCSRIAAAGRPLLWALSATVLLYVLQAVVLGALTGSSTRSADGSYWERSILVYSGWVWQSVFGIVLFGAALWISLIRPARRGSALMGRAFACVAAFVVGSVILLPWDAVGWYLVWVQFGPLWIALALASAALYSYQRWLLRREYEDSAVDANAAGLRNRYGGAR